ncbi:zinc-binding protein A33-like [Eucyclogobius newberryi]|uniref:zinc-binding protein A33-like n=1 Tax=Eucyclogobius newberryi TaxID=166745 RepID=UPI003B594C41
MEQISAVEDYLTCPVCLETFKEPVSLGCNHSFCSSCLHHYWDKNKTKKCPVCRRKSSKDHPDVNFALKQLGLFFSKKEPAPAGERERFCSSHPEVSPLFCLDECRPLCPACEFSLHSGHKVVSVDSAVSELKEQLHSQLQPLAQRREQASALQRQYEEINLHAQTQVKQCERQIRAEFERLHRFLQQEEESVLRALREEQSRQAQTIEPQLQKIREELSTLEQNILTVEEQLKRQSMDFIREYRHTHKTTQTLLSQPGPELGPGLLINQAKVLGNMGFKAWDKMRALVHYSPVLLDLTTANRWLHLSEDLRSVKLGDTKQQQIPLNPERFTKYANVLGCEGFSSGSHQWDVEVGDHPDWIIGVAKESVDRKRERGATPEYGLWCLMLKGGTYRDLIVRKILNLKRSPQKIRVRLDYDNGKLSFSDAEDLSRICSHEVRFTEKMFPFFSVGKAGDAKTKEIRIYSTLILTTT